MKWMYKFLLFIGILFTASVESGAQVIIKVRPAPVVSVRPLAPGPRHVWVGGEYIWRGGSYVYVDGYWAEPPRRFRVWKDGHWKRRHGGWVWVPGHWAR